MAQNFNCYFNVSPKHHNQSFYSQSVESGQRWGFRRRSRRAYGVGVEENFVERMWERVQKELWADETQGLQTPNSAAHVRTFKCLLSSNHNNINIALPINVSLSLTAHILISVPKLVGTLCWATGRQHLALRTHNSTICPVPVQHREVKARAQLGQKGQKTFSLIIFAVHTPFSVIVWFSHCVGMSFYWLQ